MPINSVSRFAVELGQLRRALAPADFRAYCLALALRAPSIVGARTLVPADRAMRGTIAFKVLGARIDVPLDTMTTLLKDHDNTPTFGGAREMYAGNVYLRGFRPGMTARNVVDLGSNRGLFLLLGSKCLRARMLIGVEPQAFYIPVFEALAAANGLTPQDYTWYESFVASFPGPRSVTLDDILKRHRIDRVGFLKCDIEGGEFNVFLAPQAPLGQIDNIAMELHPDKGNVPQLAATLVQAGFEVAVTDQLARPANPSRGHYLYASRSGDLTSRMLEART